MRIALGVSYNGQAYNGWQSQPNGNTVQDKLEAALGRFATQGVSTLCAGRTDAGVHGLMQVVHFDTALQRPETAWVRGTNTFLPPDIAVQWARAVPDAFHSRACATARRYAYVLLQSPVRPSVEAGRVGWVFNPLDGEAMRQAASCLIGEHDFTSFRASACQALTPVKTLHRIDITRRAVASAQHREMECCYWRFEFEGNAFLHHMVRNFAGVLMTIGAGERPSEWAAEVLAARDRRAGGVTAHPYGLYLVRVEYPEEFVLPERYLGPHFLSSLPDVVG